MNVNQHVKPSGQHYSGSNRVPTIQEFIDSLDADKKERDAAIDAELRRNRHSAEARDHLNHLELFPKKTRSVRDPVTGRDVEIRDADMDFAEAADRPKMSIPNGNLGKPATIATSSKQSGEEYRYAQDVTAPPDPITKGSTSDVPIRSDKTSVLFYKTPSVSYEPMFATLERRANRLCAAIFVGIIVVGSMFGGRLMGVVPLAVCVASGVILWVRDLIRRGRDLEWASEQERGETATINLIPESVEWMNTAIGVVWGLINPEMFSGIADTLEDVMAASVPGIIEHVRVADIQQGNNPLRILNMRALPDSQVADIKEEIRKENAQTMEPDELAAVEQAGSFYNMEVSVAYHAKPSGSDIASKARNMGMQLVFYLGVRGLFGVPLPVWVELIGLVATARVRLQLAPDPPFLKTLTITLMGLPKVQAGCTPMVERGVNILNLPLISNFVNWAIGATASIYVAPKSLTLDVSKMLRGDDIKKETMAMGVIFVRIRRAVGLSKQDQRGSRGGGSDPYITVNWSKFGKPQFCTRVIQDNLNPVFEESCGLLVTGDLVQADEQLAVELWDSDRSSADDVVGKIELSIQGLMRQPGVMFPQVSRLRGIKADSSMPGELHWEVGFFGKTQFRRALRTDGTDAGLPRETRSGQKEMKEEEEEQHHHHAESVDSAAEDAVMHTPPDPLWPSGVLSVVVHQIVGLELANVKGSNGDRRGREYEPARPEAGEVKEEQSKTLPSSYCTILINDDLVYKTRTKVVSSQPIFNAGTERFVRDWRSCIVTVAVRDSRNRQHDPLIGVVPLRVSDLMQTSSEVTRWYPLDGGIGFGRVRVSLLFRSVSLRLPPAQLGWDIGTVEFLSENITAVDYAPAGGRAHLRMRTGGSSATIGKENSQMVGGEVLFATPTSYSSPQNNSGGNPNSNSNSNSNNNNNNSSSNNGRVKLLRMPVRHRYRSPVFFELVPAGKRKADAFAALWLQDLVDGEAADVDIPLFRCDNPTRLSQSYITQDNYRSVPDLEIEEIGRLRFRARFSAGTDMDHVRFINSNETRETIETWEACYAEGVRQHEVQPEVPPLVQKLHDVSLMRDRDILQAAKWFTKEGGEWRNRDWRTSEETPSDLVDGEQVNGEQVNGEASTSADTETSRDTDGGDMEASSNGLNPLRAYRSYRERSRDLHRTHRGLMQWGPMRSVQFAKDEAKFAMRKAGQLVSLGGRKPDVETEI